MTLAILMALAAAENAAALTPAGKWKVEYADSMCVASRAFGPATDPIVFGIRPWPSSDVVELVLIRKDAGVIRPIGGHGSMLLAPSGKSATGIYSSVSDPRTGQRVTELRLTAEEVAEMATAVTVTIATGKQSVTLAPTAIPKVLPVLKSCSENLLQSWGIDPRESEAVATPAKAIPGSLTGDFYPAAAVPIRAQGTATVVWTTGVNGRATECRVVASSGYAMLDEASCKVTVSARYTPAIGKDGKPMISHSTRRVTWVLP